jgi:hypothetical protein
MQKMLKFEVFLLSKKLNTIKTTPFQLKHFETRSTQDESPSFWEDRRFLKRSFLEW